MESLVKGLLFGSHTPTSHATCRANRGILATIKSSLHRHHSPSKPCSILSEWETVNKELNFASWCWDSRGSNREEMDNSKMGFNAGQAKGQTQVHLFLNQLALQHYVSYVHFWCQASEISVLLDVMIQEKTNQMMDKASNTAQSARDSMQEVLCI